MRRTRIYLDTSPIIMMGPDQDPIRQAITQEFFRIVAEKSEEYELFVSPATLDELEAGSKEQRAASELFLATFDYTRLRQSDEAESLTETYISNGVLSEKHIDDLTHIAYAVVSRCDYVVTWNMRHLANERTFRRVNTVNHVENYGKIYLTTPEFFTGGTIYGK